MSVRLRVLAGATVFNPFWYPPGRRIAGLRGNSTCNFLRHLQAVVDIPTSRVRRFQSLHVLDNTCYFPLCFFSGTLDWNAETGELWPLDWVTSVTVWTHAWLSCQEAKEEFNYELYTIVPNCGIASRMGTDLNPSSGSYWLWDCENTIFSLWASVSSFIKQE